MFSQKNTVLMESFQILVMKNNSVTALSSIVLKPTLVKYLIFQLLFISEIKHFLSKTSNIYFLFQTF